jgi:hypothetical protein
MPNYNNHVKTGSPMTVLYPGDQFLFFNAETPIATQQSQQVAIGKRDADQPASISLELQFPADPGAFQFDLQDADTDTPDGYLSIPGGSINAAKQGPGGKFFARVELVPFKGTFLLLTCVVASANAQPVTAKVTR